MASIEASSSALKFQIFRSNVLIDSVDFYSIMLGNYIRTNWLISPANNYNKIVYLNNSNMSIDGLIMGTQTSCA